MGMLEHSDSIVEIGEKASKEFSIETMLDSMKDAWMLIDFQLKPHK